MQIIKIAFPDIYNEIQFIQINKTIYINTNFDCDPSDIQYIRPPY